MFLVITMESIGIYMYTNRIIYSVTCKSFAAEAHFAHLHTWMMTTCCEQNINQLASLDASLPIHLVPPMLESVRLDQRSIIGSL